MCTLSLSLSREFFPKYSLYNLLVERIIEIASLGGLGVWLISTCLAPIRANYTPTRPRRASRVNPAV